MHAWVAIGIQGGKSQLNPQVSAVDIAFAGNFMRVPVFLPGVFRLWLALTVAWVLVAAWLYAAGVGWKYNSYFSAGMMIVEGKESAVPVGHLPTIDQFRQMAAAAEEIPAPPWEIAWSQISLGTFPALYVREFRGPSCQSIQVRNYANVVASMPTTCTTQWSWIGFVSFLFGPAVALALVLFTVRWVVEGFIAPSDAN